MSWNYRIVRRMLKDPRQAEVCGYDHYFELMDVYYTDGKPDGFHETTFIVDPFEGPEGIIKSLKRAIETYEKYGVLDGRELTDHGPAGPAAGGDSAPEGSGGTCDEGDGHGAVRPHRDQRP